jgi:hypothetical protein
LQGHNQCLGDAGAGALRDRDQGRKNQSIQIAYIDRVEAIQNVEMHQHIVWLDRSCITYLNRLIQNANRSYCLAGYLSSSDRMVKIAENPLYKGFHRLAAIVGSGKKALESDRASNTIISNSNRS